MNRLDEIRERDAEIPDSALELFAQIRARGARLLKNQTATEDRRELLRIIDAAVTALESEGIGYLTDMKCLRGECRHGSHQALRILRGE